MNASLDWLKDATNVYDIITDPYDALKYGEYLYVAKYFAQHKELFCKSYFEYMYTLMTDTGKRFLAPLSKDFFQIIPYVSGITALNFIETFEQYIIL